MVSLFYSYIRNVIIFLIFSSFIQIIFPNNKYKSYIRLVLGLVLISIMLTPIKKIYFNLQNYSFKKSYIQNYYKNNAKNEKQFKEVQDKMILKLFNDNIKTQISQLVGENYTIYDVDVKLIQNFENIFLIESIKLTLKQNDGGFIYVKPFDQTIINEDENFEVNKIKNLISSVYNLKPEHIFITLS